MLPAPPTAPPGERSASSTARGRSGPGAPRLAWRRLLPRPRRLSRLLAIGLTVCVVSSSVLPTPVSAQRATPAARVVAQQIPTPTVTPTSTSTPTPTPTATGQDDGIIPVQGDIIGDTTSPGQVVLVPVEIGTPITFTGNPTSVSVQVQSTAAPRATVGSCTNPDFIFQGCPMADALGREAGSDAERRIEERAIDLVLEEYELPESARPLVRRYARGEIRAAIYQDIQEAFRQIPDERSPDQQLLVDVYSKMVRETHTQAMKAAQAEYRRWNTDPCSYRPPSGFEYETRSACVGMSQAFRPESPGLQAFVSYGLKNVYSDLTVEDPWAAPAFVATSSGVVLLYGAAATGYSAALGSTMAIPTSVLKVVAPFATRSALVVEGVSGGTASAGASMAGLLAILVATISTTITASMSLAKEVELPGQLQTLVDLSPNYDIEWIMRTCTSGCVNAATTDLRGQVDKEMYTSFMLTTLPDYPGTDAAPAAQPGDAQLVVDGRLAAWMRYKSDDKKGSLRAFRLGSGPWFVDRADGDGDKDARLTLQIGFKDAADNTWAIRRAGDQFILVRTGLAPTNINYPAPQQSANLSMADASGRTVTIRTGR